MADTALILRRLKRETKFWGKKALLLFLVLLAATGIIGGIYGIFLGVTGGSSFYLREIEVNGIVHTSKRGIISEIGIVDPVNIFEIDKKKVIERILSLPWVKSATIRIKLPDTLQIHIKERNPFSVIQIGKHRYYVDPDGIIIIRAGIIRSDFPPLIIVNPSLNVAGRKIKGEIWNGYLRILSSLREYPFSYKVIKVVVNRDGFSLYIKQGRVLLGWRDYLNKVKKVHFLLERVKKVNPGNFIVDITSGKYAVFKLISSSN